MSYPELDLRLRFPEIDWDEPVRVEAHLSFDDDTRLERWVCRYCIAMHGLSAQGLANAPFAFITHRDAVTHIRSTHQRELG